MPNGDAAEQYRTYAGIGAGHIDVENDNKSGGPVDLDALHSVDVEGKPVVKHDPEDGSVLHEDKPSAKAEPETKPEPAKKTAAKKTTAKKTTSKK